VKTNNVLIKQVTGKSLQEHDMFLLYLTDVISKQAIKNMRNLTLRLLEKGVKAPYITRQRFEERFFIKLCLTTQF